MANIITWFGAHWKDLAVAVLAVDQALITFLPNVTLLQKIKDWLTPVTK